MRPESPSQQGQGELLFCRVPDMGPTSPGAMDHLETGVPYMHACMYMRITDRGSRITDYGITDYEAAFASQQPAQTGQTDQNGPKRTGRLADINDKVESLHLSSCCCLSTRLVPFSSYIHFIPTCATDVLSTACSVGVWSGLVHCSCLNRHVAQSAPNNAAAAWCSCRLKLARLLSA